MRRKRVAIGAGIDEFGASTVFLKLLRYWLLPWLLAVPFFADGQDAAVSIYHLQDFVGNWQLVTNIDSTVTATERAIERDGNEVFSRVFSLKPVIVKVGVGLGTEAEVRHFINSYRPPHIPYTSPATALATGTEKFNCLEFAEDIVAQAITNGISAEVIGIKLAGRLVGHACAGFPTRDGGILYFDSTPSAGRFSERAHEAEVEIGQPYRRSDGGELGGGVGRLPISEIIPVTPLVETTVEPPAPSERVVLSPETTLMIESEDRVQARGILYMDADSLQVAPRQVEKWQQVITERQEAKAREEAAEKQALDARTAKMAAKVLQETEDLAAQGDPYAQMRMGERYLKGDGVKKNLIQARTYLQQAAAQGSPTAKDDLDQMDQ
jgi:TPR repeat protein